jgi:hypothetical protein
VDKQGFLIQKAKGIFSSYFFGGKKVTKNHLGLRPKNPAVEAPHPKHKHPPACSYARKLPSLLSQPGIQIK